VKLHFLRASLAALVALQTWAADPPKPPPPSLDVPDFRTTRATVTCVDCDAPFGTITHKEVLDGLAANQYVGALRKALYVQDSLHQFQSKAHFDNCDFDSAIAYIDSLYAEAGTHVEAAQAAEAKGDKPGTEAAARKAFFALGQALHGVQDFYAHSNYVELSKAGVKETTDLEVIAPWRNEGKAKISALRKSGLVSGFVFWGFPQVCESRSISHADLAKDSETTPSGKLRVPHLENISQYRIAVFLAREASLRLMQDAFKRWPLLKKLNGPNVVLDVLVDRRGI
jgi:Heterokaryon incompatibility protein Het-C